MLRSRLLVSALLIPAFVGLCAFDHRLGSAAWGLLALCLAIAGRCTYELADLLAIRNFRVSFPFTCAGSLAVILALWASRHFFPVDSGADSLKSIGIPAVVLSLTVLLLFVREISRYEGPGKSMESLAGNVLAIVYCGWLLAVTAQLRWVAGEQAGYFTLASLVICVKLGDVGAYTFGRLWGKRKMAPVLSPGKTWMGFVGALVGAMLGAVLWLQFGIRIFSSEWTPPALPWCLLYGVILGVVGLVGDLSESLIKRDVGKKDAAALMPGFGGLLDLVDSILYAGPVAYVLWIVLPLKTW